MRRVRKKRRKKTNISAFLRWLFWATELRHPEKYTECLPEI